MTLRPSTCYEKAFSWCISHGGICVLRQRTWLQVGDNTLVDRSIQLAYVTFDEEAALYWGACFDLCWCATTRCIFALFALFDMWSLSGGL